MTDPTNLPPRLANRFLREVNVTLGADETTVIGTGPSLPIYWERSSAEGPGPVQYKVVNAYCTLERLDGGDTLNFTPELVADIGGAPGVVQTANTLKASDLNANALFELLASNNVVANQVYVRYRVTTDVGVGGSGRYRLFGYVVACEPIVPVMF